MTGPSRRSPIVIAHRGASGYLPEHTLAAKALAHGMGADYIEQDVVLSRDGVPVVLHDIHLDCTSDVARRFPARARADGRYYALDFTLAELRQLRLHERSTAEATGNRQAVYNDRFPLDEGFFTIPTLAEEIALISGLDQSRGRTTGLYIELKAPRWHARQGADIAAAIMAVLIQTGYHQRPDQVFLQCFDKHTLKTLCDDPNCILPCIQLIGDNSWGEDTAADFDYLQSPQGLDEIAQYAVGIGPWLEHIYLGMGAGEPTLSPLVDDAHARGLLVHPYTFRRDELPQGIDSFETLLTLFLERVAVDGLFTDFPDLARQFIDTRVHDDGV